MSYEDRSTPRSSLIAGAVGLGVTRLRLAVEHAVQRTHVHFPSRFRSALTFRRKRKTSSGCRNATLACRSWDRSPPGGPPVALDPPSPDEVMRALERARPVEGGWPLLARSAAQQRADGRRADRRLRRSAAGLSADRPGPTSPRPLQVHRLLHRSHARRLAGSVHDRRRGCPGSDLHRPRPLAHGRQRGRRCWWQPVDRPKARPASQLSTPTLRCPFADRTCHPRCGRGRISSGWIWSPGGPGRREMRCKPSELHLAVVLAASPARRSPRGAGRRSIRGRRPGTITERWKLAADEFRKFLADFPTTPSPIARYSILPNLRFSFGEFDGRGGDFASSSAAFPQDPWRKALFRAGEASFLAGHLEDAERDLGEFSNHRPKTRSMRMCLALPGRYRGARARRGKGPATLQPRTRSLSSRPAARRLPFRSGKIARIARQCRGSAADLSGSGLQVRQRLGPTTPSFVSGPANTPQANMPPR